MDGDQMFIRPVNLDDVDLKIGFIGAGQMAQALCKGFIHSGLVKSTNVVCSCRTLESSNLKAMASLGIHTAGDNCEVVRSSDVVIIAVKPHFVSDVLREVSSLVHANHLVISVAAGITIDCLEKLLTSRTRIIRVMPNMPSTQLSGAGAFSLGSAARPEDSELVSRLFSSIGYCVEVPEFQLDAVTALSGSGPAYVFMMIEAMADGGVKMGLSRQVAQQLAAHTVAGAAKMVLESGKHPAELKDTICSPGGTTIAGVHQLEKSGLRAAVIGAVEAAALQAKTLSRHGDS